MSYTINVKDKFNWIMLIIVAFLIALFSNEYVNMLVDKYTDLETINKSYTLIICIWLYSITLIILPIIVLYFGLYWNFYHKEYNMVKPSMKYKVIVMVAHIILIFIISIFWIAQLTSLHMVATGVNEIISYRESFILFLRTIGSNMAVVLVYLALDYFYFYKED